MLLEGKKLLVTGVLMDSSIAFHVARLAQEQGAEIVLTSFGRTMRITSTIAKRLPTTPPVVELDVTSDEDLAALADRVKEHVPHLDGVVHSIGFAPQGAFNFMEAGWDDVSTAVQVSAYSLASLTKAATEMARRRAMLMRDDAPATDDDDDVLVIAGTGNDRQAAFNIASSTFRLCADDGSIVGSLVDDDGQVVPIRMRADVANEMTRNMLKTAQVASAC